MLHNMETLLESQLDRCIIPLGSNEASKRDWKKGYCVFRKHIKNGSKMLEFYKDPNWHRAEPKAVCNLFTDYTVAQSTQPSTKKKYTFELKTAECHYELAAQNENCKQQWMEILKSELQKDDENPLNKVIKTFDVILLDPQQVARFLRNATGVCQLLITDAEVIIKADGHHRVIWKFATIRRYKSQTGKFIIEVGRKAPTGEGEFKFDTKNPVDLFNVLETAVKDRMKAKGIEVNTLPVTSLSNTPSPIIKHPGNIERQKGRPILNPRDNNTNNYVPSPPSRPPNSPTFHPSPISPIVEDQYSHLNAFQPKSPVQKESTYDSLFEKDRIVLQRRSEPIITSPMTSSFSPVPVSSVGGKPITAGTTNALKSSQSFDHGELPLEDTYEEMNHHEKFEQNQHHDKNKRKSSPTHNNQQVIPTITDNKKPIPPPRVAPKQPTPPPPTTKKILHKANSSPVEENSYYEAPKSLNKETISTSTADKTYDKLFKYNNNNTSASEYSHLNHGSEGNNSPLNHNNNIQNDELPNLKKSKSPTGRRTVTKPSRPAPKPPINGVGETTANKALSCSAGAADNVIMQLQKRNKEITVGSIQDDLYASPTSVSVEYNQVGDLIPGQYQRIPDRILDSSGYVKVPESEPNEDIYQIPRD